MALPPKCCVKRLTEKAATYFGSVKTFFFSNSVSLLVNTFTIHSQQSAGNVSEVLPVSKKSNVLGNVLIEGEVIVAGLVTANSRLLNWGHRNETAARDYLILCGLASRTSRNNISSYNCTSL